MKAFLILFLSLSMTQKLMAKTFFSNSPISFSRDVYFSGKFVSYRVGKKNTSVLQLTGSNMQIASNRNTFSIAFSDQSLTSILSEYPINYGEPISVHAKCSGILNRVVYIDGYQGPAIYTGGDCQIYSVTLPDRVAAPIYQAPPQPAQPVYTPPPQADIPAFIPPAYYAPTPEPIYVPASPAAPAPQPAAGPGGGGGGRGINQRGGTLQ